MLVREFKSQIAEMFGAEAVKVSKNRGYAVVNGALKDGPVWWVEVWMASPNNQRAQYLMGNRPFKFSVEQYSLADVFERFARLKRGEGD